MRVELMLEEDRLFEPGRVVQLTAATGNQEAAIEFFRRQHGRCVIKLREIDSISDAEPWIGSEIRIPLRDVGPPQAGWFYTFQLKGCRVFDERGQDLGIVTDVLDLGGAQVLKVELEKTETLIPFAQEYLKKVDVDQRRIEVALPEGLRDLNK